MPQLAFLVPGLVIGVAPAPTGPAVRIMEVICERAMTRAGRPMPVLATVINEGAAPSSVTVRLTPPDGVRVLGQEVQGPLDLSAGEELDLRWEVVAEHELRAELRVELAVGGEPAGAADLPVRFLPRLEPLEVPYIPEPEPVSTQLLIGAHHCPLWEADKPGMWAQIRKHPDRTPALGFYAQESPEVADWETKWAVEHGVSFFIYCWYRASQGEPVKMHFGSAIHEALFRSRFAGNMRFTIMWENQARGRAGVADERDLMENLLPFWIENYFRHPSYLVLDGKPLLFIYRPEFLIDDLGGIDKVAAAFDAMRAACRDAGFEGLYLLGEYRGLDPNHLRLMRSLGLDYTFAYCWHVANNPTPEQAIEAQMSYIRGTQELGILPQVVTVSQGWSGWADEGSIWRIPPPEFAGLLRQASEFVSTLPPGELGSRMLLLDNWNEWGEGHYIAPHTDSGFGYLDAVRRVLSDGPEEHVDLIPEDVGLGPYDRPYREHMARERELRRLTSRSATKHGADTSGLIGWWAFDEEPNAYVALDYSGNRLGGVLHGATRAAGLDGQALVCEGGCVTVASRDALNPADALTIECWVRTEVAGQDNKWIVNRVYSAGDAGYRLGVLGGRPCFEVPVTAWSHHLQANVPLPTGRWVHLAGTFDGEVMRIYVDGEERGAMHRPGPVKPNDYPLCLGSYEAGHVAYFAGLLDEVRLYGRALGPDEIAVRASMAER